MRLQRLITLVAAVAVIPVVGSVVAAAPASASNNAIHVNTTADVIDADAGTMSLREAVAKANAQAGDDTIQFDDGATYDLTICGDPGDHTDNAVGDLNVTGTDRLTIRGPADATPTIHQTCDRRLIQSAAPLTLGRLALVGGTYLEGSAVTADAALTLDHVDQSEASGIPGAPAGFPGSAVLANSKPVSIINGS